MGYHCTVRGHYHNNDVLQNSSLAQEVDEHRLACHSIYWHAGSQTPDPGNVHILGLPLSQSFLRFQECSVRPTHVQTKTSSGFVQHPVDCLCMWPGESSSIQWTVIYKVGVARL